MAFYSVEEQKKKQVYLTPRSREGNDENIFLRFSFIPRFSEEKKTSLKKW